MKQVYDQVRQTPFDNVLEATADEIDYDIWLKVLEAVQEPIDDFLEQLWHQVIRDQVEKDLEANKKPRPLLKLNTIKLADVKIITPKLIESTKK